MQNSGQHIIGINCHFDPFISLDAMEKIKKVLETPESDRKTDGSTIKPGLKLNENIFMMVQPLGFYAYIF